MRKILTKYIKHAFQFKSILFVKFIFEQEYQPSTLKTIETSKLFSFIETNYSGIRSIGWKKIFFFMLFAQISSRHQCWIQKKKKKETKDHLTKNRDFYQVKIEYFAFEIQSSMTKRFDTYDNSEKISR